MKKRSLGLVLFLSLITLGIYLLYWVAAVQNDIKRRTKKGYSGGVTVLLMFVTLGIYEIFWFRQLGSFLDKYGTKDNNRCALYFWGLAGAYSENVKFS